MAGHLQAPVLSTSVSQCVGRIGPSNPFCGRDFVNKRS
jgi:hypothetical protein